MCKITPKCGGFADLCVFLNLSVRGDEGHSKNGLQWLAVGSPDLVSV
jgi:hypothetical protein